jgi:predicted aspartyl protease
MITGKVNAAREARIEILLFGPKNRKRTSAIIDTGFTGFLALPENVIEELALEWLCRQEAILGNGQICVFEVFTERSNGEIRERRPLFLPLNQPRSSECLSWKVPSWKSKYSPTGV